jgi:nucleoid DNA-binding protein
MKTKKKEDYVSLIEFSNTIRDKYEGAISAILVREVFELMVEFLIKRLLDNCQISINNFGTFTIGLQFSKSRNGQKFYKRKILFIPHEKFLKKAFMRKEVFKKSYFEKIGERND